MALAVNILAFALIGVIWAFYGIVGDGRMDRLARSGWLLIALLLTGGIIFGVAIMSIRSARDSSALRAWLILIVGMLMMGTLGELMERDDVAFLSTAGTGLAGAFIALALQPPTRQEARPAMPSIIRVGSTESPPEGDSVPS